MPSGRSAARTGLPAEAPTPRAVHADRADPFPLVVSAGPTARSVADASPRVRVARAGMSRNPAS